MAKKLSKLDIGLLINNVGMSYSHAMARTQRGQLPRGRALARLSLARGDARRMRVRG